jgi:hypothetical protein
MRHFTRGMIDVNRKVCREKNFLRADRAKIFRQICNDFDCVFVKRKTKESDDPICARRNS